MDELEPRHDQELLERLLKDPEVRKSIEEGLARVREGRTTPGKTAQEIRETYGESPDDASR